MQALVLGGIRFRGAAARAQRADGQYRYQQLIKGHPATKVLLEPRNGGSHHDQFA